jgi:hypothetical protein
MDKCEHSLEDYPVFNKKFGAYFLIIKNKNDNRKVSL